MLKLTKEESFLFIKVMVAFGIAWFTEVSNATPFTDPFCEKTCTEQNDKNKNVINCLIAKI
jgi:hypothetical protein